MASSWIKKLEKSPRHPVVRYQAIYRDEENKQRSAGIYLRKDDAKSALARVTVDLEKGAWVDPKRTKTTVRAYSEQWLAGKQVAASTRAKLDGQLRREILPVWGEHQLREVRTTACREWVARMTERLQPETVRGVVQTFRSLLGDAVTDGYLPNNPVRLGRGDLPRLTPSAKFFMSPGQLAALIANTHPHYRMLVHLTAWTGLRWGEVSALRWQDIDLEDATVSVVQAASRGEKHVLYYGPPKNEASRRTISLDRETAHLLRKHKLAVSGHRTWLAFRTPTNKAISTGYFRSKVWNPACVKTFAGGATGLERSCPTCEAPAGQPCMGRQGGARYPIAPHKPRFEAILPSFHDLRHSHISHLLASGVDPVTVAKRAGHASPLMTLNVYGQLRPDHVQVVNDAIDRIKGGAVELPDADDDTGEA